jgi:quinolinate synthase
MTTIAGKRVLVAAHHYQRPAVVTRAGLLGDSYKLAVEAARSDADFIVLCGVRFMAESAAILARPGQKVILPDLEAGCPMADMIDPDSAIAALARIREATGSDAVPVCYMNSSADVKALTGKAGGCVCTSGNAKKILSHYLSKGKTVFFIPDANLGMNTARALGLSGSQTLLVRRDGSFAREGSVLRAELSRDELSKVRVFLWDGYCHVHRAFTAADVEAARAENARRGGAPARIIVHPECTPDVVSLADAAGSTEEMFRMIDAAPEGSSWVVGTEHRFVERMIARYPGKRIEPLKVSVCMNMNRIDETRLDAALESIRAHLEEGRPLNAVTVSDGVREAAADALNAMVRITEGGA